MPGQQSFYKELREDFQDSLERFQSRELYPRSDIQLNQLPAEMDGVRALVRRNVTRIRDGFFPPVLRVGLPDIQNLYRKSQYKNRSLNHVAAEYILKQDIFRNLRETYNLESSRCLRTDADSGFVLLNRQHRFLVASSPHGDRHIREFNYLLPSGGYDELDDTFEGRLVTPIEIGKHVQISRTDQAYQKRPRYLSRVRELASIPVPEVRLEIAQKLRVLMDAIRFMNP